MRDCRSRWLLSQHGLAVARWVPYFPTWAAWAGYTSLGMARRGPVTVWAHRCCVAHCLVAYRVRARLLGFPGCLTLMLPYAV